jgi:L-asparaginase II
MATTQTPFTNLNNGTIITTRGPVVENTHIIHAAVVDSKGKLLYSIGNPNRITLVRSAIKPAQALAVLETGTFEKCGFDDVDLALSCASHNAEEKHVSRATEMLTKGGVRDEDLRCGGHVSLLKSVNEDRIRDGIVLTGVHSNCSGKHAAMLSAAKVIGEPLEGYHDLHHPLQQRVKKIVEEIADVPPEDVLWAIDGCNMAAPAYELHLLGKTFAAFAGAADQVGIHPFAASERTRHMARIFKAMWTHAHMIGGTTRYCTEFMYAHKGALFGKVGADACYGIGLRESERTRKLGVKGALGIAVKVEDGNLDILYAALEDIMQQLDLTPPDVVKKLEKFHYPRQENTMGIEIGRIQFHFKLRPVEP